MGENQESTTSVIEGLALVTDAMQTMFPEGKMICVYELDEIDFRKVQSNFRKIDQGHDRFSIDISGTEHVFINEKSLIPKPIETPPKKKNVRERLLSFFKSGSGPVK